MSYKQAAGVARQMERIGAQLLSIPGSSIVQQLTYAQLSAQLDAVVLEYYLHAPELFDLTVDAGNASVGGMAPAALKMYLFGLAMHWMKTQGALTTNVSVVVPDATGFSVPTPLMAFLQYVARYSEGNTFGVPQYVINAVPTVTTGYIKSGGAKEDDISSGSYEMAAYSRNLTYGEYVLAYPAAWNMTLPDFFGKHGRIYSDLVKRSGYPTIPMPVEVPDAPDGSFYTTVWNGGSGGSVAATPFSYLGSVFHKLDREIALLYYAGNEVESEVTDPVRTFGVVLPYSTQSFNSDATGTIALQPSVTDRWRAVKYYFNMVVRTMNFTLGMDIGKDKNWAGERLSSFFPIERPVSLEYYTQACWAVLDEAEKISPLTDLQRWAFMTWHHLAVLVRLQAYRPIMVINAAELDQGYPSMLRWLLPGSLRGGFKVHAALAMALNELGPVVCDGRLNTPIIANLGATSTWYTSWSTFEKTSTSYGLWRAPFNYGSRYLSTDSTMPPFDWGAVRAGSLNEAWITNYSALQTADGTKISLFVPWAAAGKIGEVAVKACTGTVAYGRSYTFFPMSNNVRGGLGMLTSFDAQHIPSNVLDTVDSYQGVAEIDGYMNDRDATGTHNRMFAVRVLLGISSHVPLAPEEVALVLFCPWIMRQTKGNSYAKYKFLFDDVGGLRALRDSIASDLSSSGGVFMSMLQDAMMKRHGSITSMGIVGPNDNPDVCLWDAAKSLLRTVGTTLLDVAPVVATVGCTAAAPGSGGACGRTAESIAGTIRDLAGVGTNRNAVGKSGEMITKMAKEVQLVAKASKGLEPQQRASPADVKYIPNGNGSRPKETKHPKAIHPDAKKKQHPQQAKKPKGQAARPTTSPAKGGAKPHARPTTSRK